MSTSTAFESPAPNNRREYFRINDRIGLRIVMLDDSQCNQLRDKTNRSHERLHQLNSMLVSSESRRAALRGIREESTAIADFLAALDERLDTLTNLMTQENSQAPRTRTHEVNLSASGLRFYCDEDYPRGARLELHLHLFPSDNCLRLYGTVAWCRRAGQPGQTRGRNAVAVDYSDIPESDREILFRHINTLQLDFVRRGIRSPAD